MSRPIIERISASSEIDISHSRRRFIGGLLSVTAGSLLLPNGAAAALLEEERKLKFYNTHTREELELLCQSGNAYACEALTKLNHFLRDHRTNEVAAIDPALIDTLYAIAVTTGTGGTSEVISGYRSPQTNAHLRSKSSGVARRSLHMFGKAIDVRLTDVPTKTLRQVAIGIKRGGVGYYQSDNFVHLDTGRVRFW